MNWIKQNRFLTILLAVVVVGTAVLGFLLFSAKSQYDETNGTYQQQSAELNRLQKLEPFPDEQNLKKMQELRVQHAATVTSLQADLAKSEVPLEQMSPEQFQDKLRATVSDVRTRAAQSGLKVPETFYMGFDRYQTEPPRPEAAGLLGRQLKAIEIVMNSLLENKVSELREIRREELPEESDKAKAPVAPAPAKGAKAGAAKGPRADVALVRKQPFHLTLFTDQAPFRNVLNNLATAKNQFYIVRSISVKNEKPTPPPRVLPGQNPAIGGSVPPAPAPVEGAAPIVPPPAPGALPAPGAPVAPDATATTYIVGDEKIEVAMHLEIIDFAEPDTAPTTAAK